MAGRSPEYSSCLVMGCRRKIAPSRFGTNLVCRHHIQMKSRHGSHWCVTYPASDLRCYAESALHWIQSNHSDPTVSAGLHELDFTLAFAGPATSAMDLRGIPAKTRAKIAFARLREAGVSSMRLAAIYLGVVALIEDDLGSHRVREFRIVQAAKAVHRLASGTHRRWHFERRDGSPGVTELHAYPRSSGLVLRHIGETLERACEPIAKSAVPAIIAHKIDRYGPHPSHQTATR